MSRDLHADLEAATLAASIAPILLASIGYAAGTERAWTGYGELTWDGEIWYGLGAMGSVSAVTETIEARANGLRFTLSGLDSARISEVLIDSRYGLPARLWLAALDTASGAIIGDPYLLFDGLTDAPLIDDSGDTCSISITAESRLVTLNAAVSRRWTPEDQKLRDPTDKGFEYVAGLQDKQLIFGKA